MSMKPEAARQELVWTLTFNRVPDPSQSLVFEHPPNDKLYSHLGGDAIQN